jgi:hypothetical protein
MTEPDINGNILRYLGNRKPTSRYASFDYCFNHFQTARERNELHTLVTGESLQLSCLHLGFYLASWGMLRGSTELLQRSVRTFVPVVEALVSAPTQLWHLDVDQYTDEAIAEILSFRSHLRKSLHEGASDILVTKVLLGTMGCVPAFDTRFKRGFSVSTFGPKSLSKIAQFYRSHADVIESHREPTLDFESGLPTLRRYTRAKVIDMVFFIEGAV